MELNAIARPELSVEPLAATTDSTSKPDFGEFVEEIVRDVNEIGKAAGQSLDSFVAGDTQDLHQVMVAMGKADIAFRYALEVRNKLMESYQEIMRLRV